MKPLCFSFLRSRPCAGSSSEPRHNAFGLLLGLVLLAAPAAWAQPTSGGPNSGTPDPTVTPIDGGASLLLAGGVSYAIRRLRRKRA